MRRVRAVTFDAYGTLFDFEGLFGEVFAELFARAGAAAAGLSAEGLGRSWGERFHALYDEFGRSGRAAGRPFRTVADLTAQALELACREHGAELDARLGTRLWLERLAAVGAYPEVRGVLERLGPALAAAVISDTDDWIIAPALGRLGWPFRLVVTSESERCYKQDPGAGLFRKALAGLGLPAGEVLHVGDSPWDVYGARLAGMRVAWLNRRGSPRPAAAPEPDWEIPDLSALPDLVESAA